MTHKTPLAIRLGLVILFWAFAAAIGAVGTGGDLTAPVRAQHRLPLFFAPSVGQAEASSSFTLRSAQLSAQFTAAQTRFDFGEARLTVRFAGANPQVRLEAADPLPGRVNYLLGNTRDQWQTDVPTYGAILYYDLYPGIDLAYGVADGRLKSEFRVSPGADPGAIRWQYQGGAAPKITGDGGLVVAAGRGELREQSPVMYQEKDGRRVPVQGAFRILDGGLAAFATGAYDRQLPLVIDPVLSYSTYLGGSGLDSVRAIAVDSAGNAYVAGQTDSLDFPVSGAVRPTSGGGVDVFIAKLNAAGNALVYSTYLGGSWDDRAFGIAVDGSGNAYVTGWTYSPNFPTTNGARQRALGGGRDAFVAKLNAAGNALLYSTYLGGSTHDSGNAIVIDGSGQAFVAGETLSFDFPVANGLRSSNSGRQDAFVAKLSADGGALLWSTYLGGYGDDRATSLAIDSSDDVYVAGATDSANFPTYHAFQGANRGGQDGFVTKLSADGRSLLYSTYLGGSGGTVAAPELVAAIRVDDAGCAFVAGSTGSRDFPVFGALQAAYGGSVSDAFVAKLSSTGDSLLFSTYLGGYGADLATGIAVDAAGTTYVVGYTSSANFPTANSLQPTIAGSYDAFLTKLNPSGTALLESTFLGGLGSDAAYAVALGPGGAVYMAGQTQSLNFPLKDPIQATNAGSYGGFVCKIQNRSIVPTATFRTTNGNTTLSQYGSAVLNNAYGGIASDTGISQSPAGDTYVAGRTSGNAIWLNIFQADTQSWKGWVYAGEPMSGNPALAVATSGDAYVVTRDSGYSYWLNTYRWGSGFQGWYALRGGFGTDPATTLAKDGTVYVVGTASTGVVWSGRYLPGAGFQGWVPGNGAGAPAAIGKPALAAGSDGAVYVAVRAQNNAVWMVRLQGDVWGTWYSGGGTLGQDPDLAASDGLVYAAYTNSVGNVYVRPFREGSGNGWQTTVDTGGGLQRAGVAAVEGQFYLTGRSFSNELWWFKSGTGWTYLGYWGLAAGNPAAAPK
jgi:hypothetical protein